MPMSGPGATHGPGCRDLALVLFLNSGGSFLGRDQCRITLRSGSVLAEVGCEENLTCGDISWEPSSHLPGEH
jgi:hypothetical protein